MIATDLARELGNEMVEASAEEIAYYSQDYFSRGAPVVAVLRPRDIEELSRCVAVVESGGLAVYPRGGGYSYTSGYLAEKPGVVIDTGAMKRVLKIDPIDNYVTVEAGCTWAKLDVALRPHGLRTPFWGPLSGLRATVGGGISQGSISFGSGEHGLSSQSVLDLEVVIGGGKRLRTGVSSQPNHSPFFRNYGPDLTGIFCSDCGALGVKAHVTLKLIKRPESYVGLSFGFPDFERCALAAAHVAIENVACDTFGLSKRRLDDFVNNSSVREKASTLWKIGRSGRGPIASLKRICGIARAGQSFGGDFPCTLHYAVEGATPELVEAKAAIIRKAVGKLGTEIPNTYPQAIRADPFRDNAMLSLTGQRQLPPSTIVPFSQAIKMDRAFFSSLDRYAERMARHNMDVVLALGSVGTSGFLYETVMRWDDKPDEFHVRHSPKKLVDSIAGVPANPEARELAAEIRQMMIDLAFDHGGIHLQIGKVYPYLRQRDEATVSLLRMIKAHVDPANTMNPGSLGLGHA